ncbi:lipopolysaccharide biosynthesis protein [Agrobacterium fabrum]|jgi:O-antigen/teichoic acid export membrane protein|uniref:Membrane protein involved in the export of O-antigen and teichoic acid n=1 Tax=Agrobacterium fabrum TaxID=1176649 RepID=A0A7Z7BPK2_9HYPH|nr:lipopolysaccharide biosynthesis protein [Agrobacterium fabrum]MCR6725895.1 lipopolysaccharide biosynthesis protein [Agrobacterium fabrum]UXT59374.1 lipopolysaccharide biosynthesis protein [Agrobacterium fabrum]WCK79026.1 lipopolysaccharide biosynthesis protein [Agrobacterium fabrum]WIE30088.1 lipopolysaccharide biosynthesis protein [Agrobacterium fabrum]WIE46048.1 lipopolysaccharide biosynthesis protein [Agrobacterium fabrum]
MAEQHSIGNAALTGVFWSIVQNWGGKLFTSILFVILARFLSPTDYGMVATAGLVLMLIQMISEFGFGDAIVQKRDLEPSDVNLPFYASVAVATLLAVTVCVFSSELERWFEVEGLAPIIVAICILLPLNTASLFQEVNYRRALAFKPLAIRTFISNIVGGGVAIAFAIMGLGVWSLVVQTYVATIVTLIWLWRKPHWLPGTTLNLRSFIQLFRFGSSALSLRSVEFASTRLIDFIILGRYGVAAFGLYTVGSRLYQILMQLLQSALYDVSLTVLSRISHERERMAELYKQLIGISAIVSTPAFVLFAALAPEICRVLFGLAWQGADEIARPLLVLGALQCVQFQNGPFLSARGSPNKVLIAGTVKSVSTILMILLIPTHSIGELVVIYVLGQLASTPFTFFYVSRELNVPLRRIILLLLPSFVSNGVSFLVVELMRPEVASFGLGDFMAGLMLGFIFVVTYFSLMALVARRQAQAALLFVTSKMLPRKEANA